MLSARRQFRFQCSRATFSDQMPGSLPNKRVPVTLTPLLFPSTSSPLSPRCDHTPLSSLIRVKITNWFRSSLCMNQASRVRDAPLASCTLSSRHPLSSDGRARTPTLNLNQPLLYAEGRCFVPTTPFHTRVYPIYCSFDSPISLRADVPSGLLPSFGIIVWIPVRKGYWSCVRSGWKLIERLSVILFPIFFLFASLEW